MTPRRTLLLAGLVAVLQIGLLSWSIADRALILRNGRDVLLKVQPMDPRDLLRGDYVALRYDISMVPQSILEGVPADISTIRDQPVFLRLKKQADGYWRPVSGRIGAPQAAPGLPDEVDIRGSLSGYSDEGAGGSRTLQVNYQLDRFYLPEGTGLEIEQKMSTGAYGIVAAVASDGTPQIKALMEGNVTLFEEPPY